METICKHKQRINIDADGQDITQMSKYQLNKNVDAHFCTIDLKIYVNFDIMKFDNERVFRKRNQSFSWENLHISDNYLKLLKLVNGVSSNLSSPVDSLFWEMEQNQSWKINSFKNEIRNLKRFSSTSSLSSSLSLIEFDKMVNTLKEEQKMNNKLINKQFSYFPRNKYIPLKRSYSVDECDVDFRFRKLDENRELLISRGLLTLFKENMIKSSGINLSNGKRFFYDSSESEESEDEYFQIKRRKTGCSSDCEIFNSTCNRDENVNWNWLLCDPTESQTVNDFEDEQLRLNEYIFPEQHFENQTTTMLESSLYCTLRTAEKFQRMRSSSVTLRRNETNQTMAKRITRSYSCDTMAVANQRKLSPCTSLNNEFLRPRSCWMRASMRLVRRFQLTNPPSPDPLESQRSESVQIHLPPLFPRDVLERPHSAPVLDRPRQYGRSAQRRVSGRVSSLSDASVSVNYTDTAHLENNANVPLTEQQPESHHVIVNPVTDRTIPHNESVISIGTQASAQTIPTSGTYEMSQESESPLGQWNHGLSSMLACLGCTLGIFNISRFAIFSIHFGANFIFQFLVLTLLIGIPLFTFHISLGQLLGTGVLNMWHISPIFKGIGVALLLSQAFIGVYSIIGVSWMFVYFRDSFISKQDVYRWAEPLELYGEDGVRTLKYSNGSYKIEQTVPDYFGGVVLQRRNVLKQEEDLMNVKFSVAFNLAIVWIIVFLSLSKGLKSYGKVVYVFSILPIFGMTLLCAKLLGFLPSTSKGRSFFPETDWSEFFLNSKSWIAAFTEVFLTWGVFGASAMQIASHNRQKHFLYRDSALVIIITISVLLLSAFIANMCSQLLEYNNFLYLPSSFERSTTYIFLQRMDIPLPYSYATTPIRWMLHSGLILGERTIKPGMNMYQESGYQPLRLATELVPATFAAIGPKLISPFWSVLFYFIFIMFGIAQQMAIWYGVISNLLTINIKALKPCWTTITWFTCIAGFILGLPMTTETGIFVVYFLDFVIGCGWWIMVLYLLQLGAIFIVRGRPYSSETIVITLFTRSNYFLQNWIAPMFSFNWNVILPVTLLLLSTSVFKNGGYRMLYNWHSPKFYEYWPPWSRKFGCLLQIMPLFTIPLVGIIQSYLYLTDGPLDLFERIQMLYRPVMENSSDLRNPNLNDVESNNRNNNNNGTNVTTNDDPPPKYTPPPSYSTATGTRIAKLLRQSFRRSMVRIAHVLGTSDSIPSTSNDQQTLPRQLPPPPDYSTVLVEINQCRRGIISVGNSSSIIGNETQCSNEQPPSSPLTAEDVANILRSSLRRNRTLPLHCNSSNNLVEQECTSIQCLVESAAPINQDSIVVLDDTKTEEQST